MVSGTGESPCEILFYESLGLPDEYRGDILVSAWSDHRVERYKLKPKGSSFSADRLPFIQGDNDFRPVGIAVAPDGSLYVTDWVLRDYNLHGKGAVWRIKAKGRVRPERPVPTDPLLSRDRSTREDAARKYASAKEGAAKLKEGLTNLDVRIRSTCLTALALVPDFDPGAIAARETDHGLSSLAVRLMVARGEDVRSLSLSNPEARREAIAGFNRDGNRARLIELFRSDDPFVRTAARRALAMLPSILSHPEPGADWLLAVRESGLPGSQALIPRFLADHDRDVRFLAAKWIADLKLNAFKDDLEKAAARHDIDTPLAMAFATAMARLNNQPVTDQSLADAFTARVLDESLPGTERALALKLTPANQSRIQTSLLANLAKSGDPALRLEAVRMLVDRADSKKRSVLEAIANERSQGEGIRAWAIVGLAEFSEEEKPLLLELARGESATLRGEALRSLTGVATTPDERTSLERIVRDHPGEAKLADRVLGRADASEVRSATIDLKDRILRLSERGNAATGADLREYEGCELLDLPSRSRSRRIDRSGFERDRRSRSSFYPGIDSRARAFGRAELPALADPRRRRDRPGRSARPYRPRSR